MSNYCIFVCEHGVDKCVSPPLRLVVCFVAVVPFFSPVVSRMLPLLLLLLLFTLSQFPRYIFECKVNGCVMQLNEQLSYPIQPSVHPYIRHTVMMIKVNEQTTPAV